MAGTGSLPDTVQAAIRIREAAARSARIRSTEDRAVTGFRYEEADLAMGGYGERD